MAPSGDDRTRSTLIPTGTGTAIQLARARLEVTEGPDRGLELSLGERPWVLGRGEAADLRLEDDAASRTHCRLEPSPEGWRVVDLGSKAGTWLDDARVQRAEVPFGARLRLGQTVLRLTLEQLTIEAPASTQDHFQGLVTGCEAMRRVFGAVAKLAPVDLPLLVQGEPGTGKEGLARACHALGARPDGPYQVVDCTLLDREHLRSELFGHRRGAFTGASADRKGAFERAHGGTLFLDEVGELPLDLQPALLRVLEEGEVRPLGADAPVRVRVRVVAATNRDLGEMARAGTFRPDLYHRLSALELTLPPLRDRPGDAALLASRWLPEGLAFSPTARQALEDYPWPGNVRELRNRVQRGAALAEGGVVEVDDLGLPPGAAAGSSGGAGDHLDQVADAAGGGRPVTLDEWILCVIQRAMQRHQSNRSAVAAELGISRTTLYRWLQKLADG